MEHCALVRHNTAPGELRLILPRLHWLCSLSGALLPEGQIAIEEDRQLVAQAQSLALPALLTLSNLSPSGYEPALAHGLFLQGKKAFSEKLPSLLKSRAYAGIMLNFQYLYPFDRERYSAFALELSELLHSQGFYLFIALAPQDEAALESLPCAAQDYAALGKAADRCLLLLQNSGEQPHCLSLEKSSQYISWASSLIPPGKLLYSMSCMGRSWELPWNTGSSPKTLSTARCLALAKATGSSPCYDSPSATHYFVHELGESRRLIRYEDSRSLHAILDLCQKSQLAGLSLWPAPRIYIPALKLLDEYHP